MVDSIFRLFAFQPYHVSQCYRDGGSRKYVRKTQTSVLLTLEQTAPDFWSLRCGFWPVVGGDFFGRKDVNRCFYVCSNAPVTHISDQS